MKEITIVTAFFDIGRENFSAVPRTNDKYLSDFKFWAGIKNNLIIYTNSNYAEKVLEIRKSYNLESKTIIIIIDNIYDIEPEIYERVKDVSNQKLFIDFRLLPYATSNIPQYSYLMLLKSWFLADVVDRNLASDFVAWIDFGYGHGGEVYSNSNEFNFIWEYPFTEKIHLFYLEPFDTKPIFETVRRLNDCIMGCQIVLPAFLCKELWKLNKQSMIYLNKVGLSDDDQLLLLMSYRENPDIFELHKSNWFLTLKEFGGENLSIRNQIKFNIVEKTLRKYLLSCYRIRRKYKIMFKYLYITYKNLNNYL
jgi:protein YibB